MQDVKILLKALSQRPIAFYPIYKEITGSTTAGILFSQIMYWWSKVDRKFYKTDQQIIEETGLSPKELRTAKQRLKQCNFIDISLEGMPAQTYYDVDFDAMSVAITTVWPKGTNKIGRKGQTCLAERDNTTRDYTETTAESYMSLSQKDDFIEKNLPPRGIVTDAETGEVIPWPEFEEEIILPLKAKKAEKKILKEKTAAAVLTYLNEKAGRKFPVTGQRAKTNLSTIKARLEEGYTEADLKRIIDLKSLEWKGTEWAKFLKPSTLFIPKHIADYLEESQNEDLKGVQAGPVFDIDLNGQSKIYNAWWESVKSKYPETAKAIPFLKASEFADIRSKRPKWAPMYWDKVGKGPHKKGIQDCLELLESDKHERKKAKGGLYLYLTGYLKENVLTN